ncbi:hypothetical protein ACTHO5_27830 [Cytobacillus praedii]
MVEIEGKTGENPVVLSVFLHEKSGKKSLKRLEKQGEKQEGKQEQS